MPRYVRHFLSLAVILLVSACGQRYGAAPVVNGSSGEQVQTGPVAAAPVTGSIRVQRGDSLYRIARRYNVGLRSLIDANRLKPPYTIFPGQKLQLPVTGLHVVRRGETIYQIARVYNTEPGTLVRLNGIQPPYRLATGQRIKLPGTAARQPASTTVAAKKPANRSTARPRTVQKPPRQTQRRAVLPAERPKVKRAPTTSRAVKPPAPSRGGFIWPVSGRILSKFGSIGKGLQNDGINILARKGTPVRAIQNGVVAYAGNELRGFGNLLLVKHSGGWISAYAHNAELLVRTGQRVRRGQIISRVGSTGSVDKPQLHFELRRGKRAVDPERYLGRRTAQLRR